MSFEFRKKLPIPQEIKAMYPMSEALTAHKKKKPPAGSCCNGGRLYAVGAENA